MSTVSAPTRDRPTPPRRDTGVRTVDVYRLQAGIGVAETAIYVVVAALLLLAAGMTVVGTISDLLEGADARGISDAGLFILERVLLLFIIAELLYTLRIVNFGGQILVEPFLFIGLIAVVRKILVIAIEAEEQGAGASDFATRVGVLAALALVLSLAVLLLRLRRPA